MERNASSDIVISVKGLYKIFGPDPQGALEDVKRGKSKKDLASSDHILAVHDINIEIERGKIFVVMGLSGSGKSTFLRCINRLLEPTSGSIMIDGIEVTSLSRKELLNLRLHKLGMVFQHFALLPNRNIVDNVSFGLEVKGEKLNIRNEKAREMLKLVGLEGWEHHMPGELSGGMQQRVGLARAMVLDPPILLLDEPFSGLDPLIRKEMQNELLGLQERLRKTMVFITHDLDEALKLGARIMILKDGQIEQIGTSIEIVLSPATDYIKAFVQDVDPLKVLPAEKLMTTDIPIFPIGGKSFSLEIFRGEADRSIFIVDEEGRYLGTLPLEKLQNALTMNPEMIPDQIQKEAPCLKREESVRNILDSLARSPFVVAVTNSSGQLIGAITRESLFSGLEERNEQ